MKILCRFLSTETFANKASLNKIIICGSFKVILTNLSSYHGPAEIGEFSKSINLNLSFKMNPLLSSRLSLWRPDEGQWGLDVIET